MIAKDEKVSPQHGHAAQTGHDVPPRQAAQGWRSRAEWAHVALGG
jgi:hypothetical protein